ncbi:MAG TPA: hypothetical protein VJ953_12155 [Saprospiraceae bacterium]|nr:hypothetical protein [Saprospiraceae bacterium]
MRLISYKLPILFLFLASLSAKANINPKAKANRAKEEVKARSFRENCDNALAQTDMDINNVRARLTTGGDVWWDSNDGVYVVPKNAPGQPPVSSIFAGAVWLGGVDPAGNLKVAAQTYGRSSGDFDYWPGPLDPETGTTNQEECAKWDKFFTVTGESIDEHLRNWEIARANGESYDPDDIPIDVKGWPARGNEFFFDIHQFELPNTSQGLAGFWDQDGDGLYNPELGDFPVIEIRGCLDKPQFPDEMTFWVYNDGGNIHAQSQGDPIQMEVQVQAFAYATNDEINDMTFQRYKLINRAVESIDSTYFAMWVDPDLGCFTDDYIGCDTTRSLAYVYNEDALDGQTGCACPGGVNTYCDEIPILGVDYFRGPLDELGNEIGMSSFTYYNNAGVGSPQQGTTDPENALEYYYYLSGRWKDGSPFTFGDDAYRDGFPVEYAFTEAPDDPTGWSMCTAGLPFGDRRTIQASGPFRLDPGAVNELIVGAVWVADQSYPCPSLTKLLEADDIAQALFDNCFEITDGPDAPDVDYIELDKEIIAVFTNDTISSNNAYEAYAQKGLQIPAGTEDSLYVFEGYKLFQLAGPNVTIADLDDPGQARVIYQVDIKNGVSRIFNWSTVDNPTGEEYYVPELQVEGRDEGIQHTFRITEDQFAEGDRRLVNHRKYYFTAVAYAYNNYLEFDPKDLVGQRNPYLEGRRNIGDGDNPYYTVVPRPAVDRNLNTVYGDGAIITRLDGKGNGGVFLDMDPEERNSLLSEDFDGEITYRPGAGPVDVRIFNPLDVRDGEFELRFVDANMNNDVLEPGAGWELRNLSDPNAPVIYSEQSLDRLNEQIIREYGFSISLGQVDPLGANPFTEVDNGVVGYDQEYTGDTGLDWINGVFDGYVGGPIAFDQQAFDYVANQQGEPDADVDPNQQLNNIGPGYFIPYYMANWRQYDELDNPYVTPAWSNLAGSATARNQMDLEDVPNVDIVLTPNKELWSRCVVIETSNRFDAAFGFESVDNRQSFDLRAGANVTRFDNDGDGLPDIDNDNPGEGLGWFPGYAVNVETGERLNIFFGENSVFRGTGDPQFDVGADMMYNPSPTIVDLSSGDFTTRYFTGGHHFVYVANTAYDEGESMRRAFAPSPTFFTKLRDITDIVWTGILVPNEETPFTSYEEGLIPNEAVIKLRVNSPYKVAENAGTGIHRDYPAYRFRIEGKAATDLTEPQYDEALRAIKVVPNPYYGFSSYEVSQFTNIVKITNLPAQCVVTIYSLDGKFIRQYNRDEIGLMPEGSNRAIDRQQISPALEWDLKNSKGIPIASGVYLIHVDAGNLGERTIKWFGINRKFDPSGL